MVDDPSQRPPPNLADVGALPRSEGWQCEDCPYFADSETEAFAHCDQESHSLARAPRPVLP